MCIYYKNREDLTYTSGEHVIPAGIGGIKKLPVSYVSDQFNNYISKLEKRFLRNSVVATPRIFVGPGKRGSLSESKATKSKIQLIKSPNAGVEYSLGYTKLGKPYEIPNLLVNTVTGMCAFSFDKSESGEHHTIIDTYKAKCEIENWLKIKITEHDELPVDIVLIGIKEGIEDNYNCFVYKNPANRLEISPQNILGIARGINFDGKTTQSSKYMPYVHDSADFNEEYFRIYGKIAFNFLALIKGDDFVNDECFDGVREWIAKGGENNFAAMLGGQNPLRKSGLSVPEQAHTIIVTQSQQMVVANIFLYDNFGVQVLLSNSFRGNLSLQGYICDWKNKKEYNWYEYLTKILSAIEY